MLNDQTGARAAQETETGANAETANESDSMIATDHPTQQTSAEIGNSDKGPNLEQTIADAEREADGAETVTGFAPFRHWFNRELRNQPAGVSLQHGGTNYSVTELTNDCRLRLETEGRFVLLPFDERYIPIVMHQIL